MCIYDDPPTLCTVLCNHEPLGPATCQPLPSFLLAAQLLMEQQAPALHCITEQMQQLKDSVRSVRSDLATLRSLPKFSSLYPSQSSNTDLQLTVDANQLVAYLSGEEGVVYTQALKLVSDLPCPLYKHQPFSCEIYRIEMKLVGINNEPAEVNASMTLRVRMFKATYPEEELHNDSRCVLTGPVLLTVNPGDRLLFTDLAFTEVTSNFEPNWIYLTVESIEQRFIRPLIIEGVRVKSRAPKS